MRGVAGFLLLLSIVYFATANEYSVQLNSNSLSLSIHFPLQIDLLQSEEHVDPVVLFSSAKYVDFEEFVSEIDDGSFVISSNSDYIPTLFVTVFWPSNIEAGEVNIISQTSDIVKLYVQAVAITVCNIDLGVNGEVALAHVHINDELSVNAGNIEIIDLSYLETASSLEIKAVNNAFVNFLHPFYGTFEVSSSDSVLNSINDCVVNQISDKVTTGECGTLEDSTKLIVSGAQTTVSLSNNLQKRVAPNKGPDRAPGGLPYSPWAYPTKTAAPSGGIAPASPSSAPSSAASSSSSPAPPPPSASSSPAPSASASSAPSSAPSASASSAPPPPSASSSPAPPPPSESSSPAPSASASSAPSSAPSASASSAPPPPSESSSPAPPPASASSSPAPPPPSASSSPAPPPPSESSSPAPPPPSASSSPAPPPPSESSSPAPPPPSASSSPAPPPPSASSSPAPPPPSASSSPAPPPPSASSSPAPPPPSASSSPAPPPSASPSPVHLPCTAGWVDTPSVNVVPPSDPVSSTWNNPTWVLNDFSKNTSFFPTNEWNQNSTNFFINQSSIYPNTITFQDKAWGAATNWLVSEPGIFPGYSIVKGNSYTFSFNIAQDSTNKFSPCSCGPSTALFNITVIVSDKLQENAVWAWRGVTSEGPCQYNYCTIEYYSEVLKETLIPLQSAPMTVSITFTATHTLKAFQFGIKFGETQRPVGDNSKLPLGGNLYYFSNFKFEKHPLPRSFINPLISKRSQYIDLPLQPSFPTPDQTDCPHLQSGLLDWHLASTWPSNSVPVADGTTNVTLPDNSKVLISSCSLLDGIYGTIVIPQTSELIFFDSNIHLKTGGIIVQGKLSIGSPTCRLWSKISIEFSDTGYGLGSYGRKGIAVYPGAYIDIHGKLFQKTWTKLASPAYVDDDRIVVQEDVNWEVGQTVFITTTIEKDWNDDQNEVLTIKAIQGRVIQFNELLKFDHYAGVEYQAEVGLLSRNIVLRGDDSSETTKFGGHVISLGTQARYSGIELFRMGQKNVMARYPLHFHMMHSSPTSFIQDCAFHHTYYRCVSIHGSNDTTLSRNVAFDITAHCYYIEDGVEEGNLLEYNLAANIHPITEVDGTPTDWYRNGYGQDGIVVVESPQLLIPADVAAGGFYITNANNQFIGNAASGGFAGFSFVNLPACIGLHKTSPIIPQERPLKKFYGNSAHSSAWQWNNVGAIYVGGLLYYDGSTLTYNVGRHERNTKSNNGTADWMEFEQTQVFLANDGLFHWGQRADLVSYEALDVNRGATTFGEASLLGAYINAFTNNPQRDGSYCQGFQFYDTFVKTILSNITFTNFPFVESATIPENGNFGIMSMTHSDVFKPQGISATKGIQWPGVDSRSYMKHHHRNTGSSRYFNFMDWDGSATGFPFGNNVPVLVGSADVEYYDQANTTIVQNWWKLNDNCVTNQDWILTMCKKTSEIEVASVLICVDKLTCYLDTSLTWPQQDPTSYVGRISQFGHIGDERRSTIVTMNPTVTGSTGKSGWYLNFDLGSPDFIKLTTSNIPLVNGVNTFFILAIRYPSAAQFEIRTKHPWKTAYNSLLTKGNSINDVVNDLTGTTYYFNPTSSDSLYGSDDGEGWLYLRIQDRHFNDQPNGANFFERGGVRVYDVVNFYYYTIKVTCAGCASNVVNGVTYFAVNDKVPSALP